MSKKGNDVPGENLVGAYVGFFTGGNSVAQTQMGFRITGELNKEETGIPFDSEKEAKKAQNLRSYYREETSVGTKMLIFLPGVAAVIFLGAPLLFSFMESLNGTDTATGEFIMMLFVTVPLMAGWLFRSRICAVTAAAALLCMGAISFPLFIDNPASSFMRTLFLVCALFLLPAVAQIIGTFKLRRGWKKYKSS